MNTQQTDKTSAELNVCPNCHQWQHRTQFGYYDCFHGCAKLSLAPKIPTPGFEQPVPAQAQHSPLPWNQDPTGDVGWWLIGTSDRPIATVENSDNDEVEQANAEFIVRACNNAQRLADSLKEMMHAYGIGLMPSKAVGDRAREALKQWEQAQ